MCVCGQLEGLRLPAFVLMVLMDRRQIQGLQNCHNRDRSVTLQSPREAPVTTCEMINTKEATAVALGSVGKVPAWHWAPVISELGH